MKKTTKSKQQTCYAIDACTEDQLIDIFEESFGYLSFVQKFANRIKKEPIDYETDSIAASDKPLLVLDIDNTILFIRYFADEICVNDKITYFHNDIHECHGIVTSVWYRLKLQLTDDELIDEYNTDIIEYDHCHTDIHRLKKRKTFLFPYKINEETNTIIDCRQTVIKSLDVIGCEIEYYIENAPQNKYISFEEDSIEIENFLPSLTRKGYKHASFVHDGFLVRIRNGVEDFLDQLTDSWDIVFFTAANRTIYDRLMQSLHAHLCEIMGRDEEDEPLWKHIFFRQDCTYDYDERGKIFHHKDLTKYNRDLSKVVIVDNSSLSYKSLEPNAILIKDFFGKDDVDNELDIVLEILFGINDIENEYENDKNVYIDYRYLLTRIWEENNLKFDDFDLHIYNRRNADDMVLSTERFLNDFKESLIKKGKLPSTLKFEEPKDLSDVFSENEQENENMEEAEDDDGMFYKSQSPSLESSVTNEVKVNEGLATPVGAYEEENESGGVEDALKNVLDEVSEFKINEPLDDSIASSSLVDSVRYSISVRMRDIPHLNVMDAESKSYAFEDEIDLNGMNTPNDDLSNGVGSRTIDDDDSDLENDENVEHKENNNHVGVNDDDDEKVENYRHIRRFSTMAPHPNQMALAPGLASVSLKFQKAKKRRKLFGILYEGQKKIKHAMHRRKVKKKRKHHKKEMINAYRNLSAFHELNTQIRHQRTLRYVGNSMFRVINDYKRVSINGYYSNEQLLVYNEYFHA